MKKLILLLAIFFAALTGACAQTVIVSGTVKTSQGDFLCYAFIHEQGAKSGVYTDTLGAFTLTAKTNSMLQITCFGYRDTTIKAMAGSNLAIILSPVIT